MTLSARVSVAFATLAATLAVAVAGAAGLDSAGLLAAVAASAALVVVATATVRALTVAPPAAALRVGHRGHAHRESFDHVPEPAHPDTAGRSRSRAPGGAAPAV